MRRRAFIALLGGIAALRPVAAAAEQANRIRHVGVLIAYPEHDSLAQAVLTAFAQALGRLGWFEGRNIRIYYRFEREPAGRSYPAGCPCARHA